MRTAVFAVAALLAQGQAEPRQNRLSKEKSPYLLQHAKNPVDWYPWGDEAFERAKKENKPILLSIGYSTCHWCHVMERESFENAEIAKVMNDLFVSIKVDREERPDVDRIYMDACTKVNGHGGWPLTILMTADRKPFFAGTYFPPDRFTNLLKRAAELWEDKREVLLEESRLMTEAVNESAVREGELGPKLLEDCAAAHAGRFDEENGGYGRAPKFPHAPSLSFALAYQHRKGDAAALAQARKSLDKMARGGIFDHLGGGFHRYATDAAWLVPHFEKMLYDQALLVRAYVDAFRITGEPLYESVARKTIAYVRRDLTGPEGAFLSAEDADSEGVEGKFYVWRAAEIAAVLGEAAAKEFSAYYGVTKEGNFEEKNILNVPDPDPEKEKTFEQARAKLFAVREKRIRPHKDDKVLTDWNGLMIGALAQAAQAFGDSEYARAAERAAEFALLRMRRPDGRLLHRYRDGKAEIAAFVDDYAFLTAGLLDLYEATFAARWLRAAAELTRDMLRLFRDEKDGGLFFSGRDGEELIAKTKEAYDGAVPSGNSAAALNLLRLGHTLQDEELRKSGARLLKAFGGYLSRAPMASPQMLVAVDFLLGPTSEVVLVGEPVDEMRRALGRRYHPNKVVVFRSDDVVSLAPALKDYRALNGRPTAYVCRNFVCQAPTADPAAMMKNLVGSK